MKLPYHDPFAQRLRARRDQLGISQKKLAAMLDPTVDGRTEIKAIERAVASISRYERGERMPKVDRLRQLCLALDVSADWLIGIDFSVPSIPAPASPNHSKPNHEKGDP